MTTLKKVVKTGGVTHLAHLSGLATSNYPNLDFITNPNDVYNVTETQKLDWLRGQLKQRLAEYTTECPLYIFCGTWNVNAKKPPSDLTRWLIPGPIPSPLADPNFKASHNDGANQTVDIMPDVYALGFQEVVDLKIGTGAAALGNNKQTKQASKNWEAGIMGVLGSHRYTLVKAKHLVGLSLHVYVKNELLPHIQDVRHEKVGVGFMGVGGNKGGVAIRFRIHDSSYVFINSHLAAHASKCDARNQDFKSILERLKFHTSHVPVHAFPFQVVNSPYPAPTKISSQQYQQQQQTPPVVGTMGLEHHQYQAGITLASIDPQAQKNKDNSNQPNTGKDDKDGNNKQLRSGDSGKGGVDRVDGNANAAHPYQASNTIDLFEPLNISRHVNYPAPTEKTTLNGIPIIHSQHTQPFPNPNSSMTITQHDNCFWLGDLNYRLNIPLPDIHQVYETVKECESRPPLNLLDYSNYSKRSSAQTHYHQPIRYSKLLHLDQLLQVKATGQAFVDWHEGIIDFPPTYKYQPGTTQWDPEHKRVPSWCDRIQWIGSDITQLAYQSVPLTISDHFPVRGVFRTVSRGLDLYKKIVFVQLLLKHYLAMQILSSPRLMFSQSIYSLGYLHYDIPVISQLVLFNPTKRTLFWRLISPYDAKHIIDDGDVKKLTSRSHLALSSQTTPGYYSSPNHHHGMIPVHGGTFKGPGFGPNLDDRNNTAAQPSGQSQPSALLNPASQQQQQQSDQNSLISPSIRKQQLQLQHHLLHNNQLNHVQASLKRTGLVNQSGSTQHALQLSHNTMVAGQHPANVGNIHYNQAFDKSNPLFKNTFVQQLFLPHDAFQYRQTHKKTNSIIANAQVIPPQPHLVTYIPQRNDPYTHLHPTWLKFQQLQGKIGPGQLLTLPYLVHIKRHDALKLTTNKQQVSATLFFATSFSPLNSNNNISVLSNKESTNLSSHISLNQAQASSPLPPSGPASAILSSGMHGDFNQGTNRLNNGAGILKNAPATNPSHALINPATVNQVPTTYHPGLTGVSVNLAPSHLSLSMQQRNYGVNVFSCRLRGTFQYSTYGLSLAFLCDTHDSIRSLQVQQALMTQVNGVGTDGNAGNKSPQQRQQQQAAGGEGDGANPPDINSVLSSQNQHYMAVLKPEFENKYSKQFQQAPQPIPKEFFQLVNALVQVGLENPKHFIMSDFQEYIDISNSSRTRSSKENTAAAMGSGANQQQQAVGQSAVAPQLPPRPTDKKDPKGTSSSTTTQSKNSLLALTQPRSATNIGTGNGGGLLNTKNGVITKSINNTIQRIGKQRLHLHTICPRVDNFMLHAALVTCLDEQHPIPTNNYQNTSVIWFTVLDLLFNLPEPLFPLGLMDKVVKFRLQNNNNINGENPANKTASSPEQSTNSNGISAVTLTSSSQSPPEMNPYSVVKYLPQPMLEFHQTLCQHQMLKLMTSFCFYLLKWLPVSHYNLFIYLLALIKKVMSLLTTSYPSTGSRATVIANQNPAKQLVYNNNVVDIDRLTHYIITKFTQACCQIKTLHATQTIYALPLAIISHLLKSPDFL